METTTKHTKGEWGCTKIHKTASGRLATEIITKDASIADVYGKSEEAQANAKLIAAAPELLEALMNMVDYYVHDKDLSHIEYEDMHNQALKAITKATK